MSPDGHSPESNVVASLMPSAWSRRSASGSAGTRSSGLSDRSVSAADAESPLMHDFAVTTADLFKAVYFNNCEQVQRLLEAGIDPDTKHETTGRTPLHAAAIKGHRGVVAVLLRRAQVNLADNLGWTALHITAWYGRRDVCSILLAEPTTDVDLQEYRGNTPLHYAARNGHRSICKRLLKKRSAEVNARAHDGRTPLHRAAAAEHDAVCSLLLRYGAVVDAPDNQLFTALHTAAGTLNCSLCKLLLDAGADVLATDFLGRTPLHVVLSEHSGNENVTQLLLDAGADPLRPDFKGVRPIDASSFIRDQHVAGCELFSSPDSGGESDVEECTVLRTSPILIYKARHQEVADHGNELVSFPDVDFAAAGQQCPSSSPAPRCYTFCQHDAFQSGPEGVHVLVAAPPVEGYACTTIDLPIAASSPVVGFEIVATSDVQERVKAADDAKMRAVTCCSEREVPDVLPSRGEICDAAASSSPVHVVLLLPSNMGVHGCEAEDIGSVETAQTSPLCCDDVCNTASSAVHVPLLSLAAKRSEPRDNQPFSPVDEGNPLAPCKGSGIREVVGGHGGAASSAAEEGERCKRSDNEAFCPAEPAELDTTRKGSDTYKVSEATGSSPSLAALPARPSAEGEGGRVKEAGDTDMRGTPSRQTKLAARDSNSNPPRSPVCEAGSSDVSRGSKKVGSAGERSRAARDTSSKDPADDNRARSSLRRQQRPAGRRPSAHLMCRTTRRTCSPPPLLPTGCGGSSIARVCESMRKVVANRHASTRLFSTEARQQHHLLHPNRQASGHPTIRSERGTINQPTKAEVATATSLLRASMKTRTIRKSCCCVGGCSCTSEHHAGTFRSARQGRSLERCATPAKLASARKHTDADGDGNAFKRCASTPASLLRPWRLPANVQRARSHSAVSILHQYSFPPSATPRKLAMVVRRHRAPESTTRRDSTPDGPTPGIAFRRSRTAGSVPTPAFVPPLLGRRSSATVQRGRTPFRCHSRTLTPRSQIFEHTCSKKHPFTDDVADCAASAVHGRTSAKQFKRSNTVGNDEAFVSAAHRAPQHLPSRGRAKSCGRGHPGTATTSETNCASAVGRRQVTETTPTRRTPTRSHTMGCMSTSAPLSLDGRRPQQASVQPGMCSARSHSGTSTRPSHSFERCATTGSLAPVCGRHRNESKVREAPLKRQTTERASEGRVTGIVSTAVSLQPGGQVQVNIKWGIRSSRSGDTTGTRAVPFGKPPLPKAVPVEISSALSLPCSHFSVNPAFVGPPAAMCVSGGGITCPMPSSTPPSLTQRRCAMLVPSEPAWWRHL
ncbi:Ankyrin repeat [Diplonema papillatum]|nr:Ankyrin repeat [Diplonema papillatum]